MKPERNKKTVILTRLPRDNRPLKERLLADNMRVIEAPCLAIHHIEPEQREVRSLPASESIGFLSFSSRHGVDGFLSFNECAHWLEKNDASPLIAAVGPATASCLQSVGLKVSIIADPATGEQLARQILKVTNQPRSLVAVRGNTSLNQTSRLLSDQGYKTHALTVYRNEPVEVPKICESVDAVVLTSPTGVRRFFASNAHLLATTSCVAIGRTTARALADIHANVIEAESTGTDNLCAALRLVLFS